MSAIQSCFLTRIPFPPPRYAYGTDPSEPGQLKVHLGQVPVDGDYWVVGLGPDTFGPDGAYEWALVSGP